jgi:hypothetical protein
VSRVGDSFSSLAKMAKDQIIDPVMRLISFAAFEAFKLGVKPLKALLSPLTGAAVPPGLFKRALGNIGALGLDKLVEFISGKVAPEFGGQGVEALAARVMQQFPGLSITSALRPGDPGYHGKGWARDLGGPVPLMNAAARWMTQTMTTALLEGIHNPGLSVKNYKQVPPGFWGPGTWAGHADHIHMAAEEGRGGGVFTGPATIRRVADFVLRAFGIGGMLNLYMNRLKVESGFNTQAVNRWDINWQRGTPSVGVAQVIGPTFAAYAGRYRSKGPFLYGVSTDPLANIWASVAYSIARYGRAGLARAWGGTQGYAKGGILNEPVMGVGLHTGRRYSFGENAPRVPEAWSPLANGAPGVGGLRSGTVINVYPQRGQSETEVAAAVSRRLEWARATGRA